MRELGGSLTVRGIRLLPPACGLRGFVERGVGGGSGRFPPGRTEWKIRRAPGPATKLRRPGTETPSQAAEGSGPRPARTHAAAAPLPGWMRQRLRLCAGKAGAGAFWRAQRRLLRRAAELVSLARIPSPPDRRGVSVAGPCPRHFPIRSAGSLAKASGCRRQGGVWSHLSSGKTGEGRMGLSPGGKHCLN